MVTRLRHGYALQRLALPCSEDYSELSETLVQLEGYERRAFSRRKRGMLAMSEK